MKRYRPIPRDTFKGRFWSNLIASILFFTAIGCLMVFLGSQAAP